MDGHDTVIHLASNPDIAPRSPTRRSTSTRAPRSPTTWSRRCARRRRRACSTPRAAGSTATSAPRRRRRTTARSIPTSTYGASKLAGEALIASYVAMFDLTACAFRFGNVVGARQTHGVGFDFVRRLLEGSDGADDPRRRQPVEVVHRRRRCRSAVLTAHRAAAEPFRAYNVATGDYITVTEIAGLALEVLGLDPAAVRFEYSGGDRGWKGDVPIVRLNTDRIRALGLGAVRRLRLGAVRGRCAPSPATNAPGCSDHGTAGRLPRPRRRAQRGRAARRSPPPAGDRSTRSCCDRASSTPAPGCGPPASCC